MSTEQVQSNGQKHHRHYKWGLCSYCHTFPRRSLWQFPIRMGTLLIKGSWSTHSRLLAPLPELKHQEWRTQNGRNHSDSLLHHLILLRYRFLPWSSPQSPLYRSCPFQLPWPIWPPQAGFAEKIPLYCFMLWVAGETSAWKAIFCKTAVLFFT